MRNAFEGETKHKDRNGERINLKIDLSNYAHVKVK